MPCRSSHGTVTDENEDLKMIMRMTLEYDDNVFDKDDYDNSRVFLGAKAPHRCRMPGEHVNSAYHDYAQVFKL